MQVQKLKPVFMGWGEKHQKGWTGITIVSFLCSGGLQQKLGSRAAQSHGVVGCAPPQSGSCHFPVLAGVIFILPTGLR